VVLIMLDDMGFGQAGSSGGPVPPRLPFRVNNKGNFRLSRFQTLFFYDSVAGFSGHLIPDVGMLSRRRPVVKRRVTNRPIQASNETGRTLNCLVSKMSDGEPPEGIRC
jgi:hypothetical protein